MRRYTLLCEESTARQIEVLAGQYDLTEQEVIQQLLDIGLEEVDDEDEVGYQDAY